MGWHFVWGRPGANNDLVWEVRAGNDHSRGLTEGTGLMIAVTLAEVVPSRFGAISKARQMVANTRNLSWLKPGNDVWVIDFDSMKASFPGLQELNWLQGTIRLRAEHERASFSFYDFSGASLPSGIVFYVSQDMIPSPPESRQTTQPSHVHRWEPIRILGTGGQGTVTLVRDIRKCESRPKVRESILESIESLVSSGAQVLRESAADSLISAIEKLLVAEKPSHLGALKELHQPKDARDPERAKERMQRELKAMLQIDHPNLIKIIDSQLDEYWFVSEYHCDGSLTNHQRFFSGNAAKCLRLFRSIVSGVAALHSKQMVHRDIKADNILLSREGQPILGDFGLVYFTEDDHTRLSGTLENVGSRGWQPSWAEGIRIEEIKPSFNVFSLGKLLWWMASGRPIQNLHLWYYDRNEAVTKLFPNARHMHLIKRILSHCVVESEEQCFKSAVELLELVDECIGIIEQNADPMDDEVVRKCQVCGIGTYSLQCDRDMHKRDEVFGVKPSGNISYKIFTCTHCGHVQFFHFNGIRSPAAWKR